MNAVWQYISEHQETNSGNGNVCSTLKGKREFLTLVKNYKSSRSMHARSFREWRIDPIDNTGSNISDWVSEIRLSLESRPFRVDLVVIVKFIIQGWKVCRSSPVNLWVPAIGVVGWIFLEFQALVKISAVCNSSQVFDPKWQRHACCSLPYIRHKNYLVYPESTSEVRVSYLDTAFRISDHALGLTRVSGTTLIGDRRMF